MALDDIRRERLKKLERYEAAGHEAYPPSVRRSLLVGDILKKFSRIEKSRKPLSAVGRLRGWREHGGAVFGDLGDASGRIQLYFSRSDLGDSYERARDVIDIGDFLEISGRAFKTKRGEPTVRVLSWRLISKSLLPLPEKWHGLKDVEERFRRRYLDLLMNDEVRARFRMRSDTIRALREFFDAEGFVEVETPMLQAVPGGALARPFKTRHHALGIDLYLRIAPELYLKELLVGGMEKVYELGKSFRNEGIDPEHNPEFTTIEWYAAYWDEEDMMACVERCFAALVKKLKLGSAISFGGAAIAVGKKFPRIAFGEVLKRYALVVDYDRETRDTLALKAKQFGIEAGPRESKAKIADEIYKKICRPHLVQPTFVVHHPLDISPLAKSTASGAATVRRFQLIAGGLELVNGYAELNDPRDQASRLEQQAARRAAGEEETHPLDRDFIEALEYGMPPAAGAGIGIDRLIMLLTDAKNIREVVLFPTLRPKAS